jgi:hypothetical protein
MSRRGGRAAEGERPRRQDAAVVRGLAAAPTGLWERFPPARTRTCRGPCPRRSRR